MEGFENEIVLQVRNLITCLRIGNHHFPAVDHLSFNLFRGKTLALVGESGCGKSLTALSLLRILPHPPALPPQGEVIYQNRNLLSVSEKEMRQIRGGKIAMIFQDPMSALNPVYTIGYQLAEAAILHLKMDEDEAFKHAAKTLSSIGIPSPYARLNDYPHQLSGGMKQRVMIAMALMCEPDILIADEPTTALDVTVQAQVLDLMRDLQKKKGMAILLITHDMGVVAEMADCVIVMYASQAIEEGFVGQVFDFHAHPYTKGLFNSRAVVEKEKKRLTPIEGSVPSIEHFPRGCRFHTRCPFVMEKCKHGKVPDFFMSCEKRHYAKCWLYDQSQESNAKLSEENYAS